MKQYEVLEILKSMPYLNRSSWEQARFMSFITARVGGAKIEETDLKQFPWDKEKEEIKPITDNDVNRLEQKAKQIIEQENGRLSNENPTGR